MAMPTECYRTKRELALNLVDAGVVRTTGSDFSLNFRMIGDQRPGPLTFPLVSSIAQCMECLQNEVGDYSYNAVLGICGEAPIAQVFAASLGLAFISSDEEGDNPIPRHVREALVFVNVLSSGVEYEKQIHALRDRGVCVDHIMVIVDLEQGGRKKLAELNCEPHVLFTASELFEDAFGDSGQE